MMTRDTIEICAKFLADNVTAHFRRAEVGEKPALNSLDVLALANEFNDSAAMTLAATMLETSRWVPRSNMLNVDDEDDLDEILAKIIARKAIRGYEPIPYGIVKECNGNWLDSGDLVSDVMPKSFATDEQMFVRVLELVEEFNESNGGYWWTETEPEPFDAELPYTIVSRGKDESF